MWIYCTVRPFARWIDNRTQNVRGSILTILHSILSRRSFANVLLMTKRDEHRLTDGPWRNWKILPPVIGLVSAGPNGEPVKDLNDLFRVSHERYWEGRLKLSIR